MEVKKKILLVDDEEDALLHLGNILKSSNYEVISTPRGKEAIGLAKETKPDLIILDVLMPDMDGTDVALALKDDPYTKNIPIIFLTGMLTRGEELLDEKIHRHRAIAKPITKEEVLNTINEIFPV